MCARNASTPSSFDNSLTIRLVTCFCKKAYGSAGLSFIKLCIKNCMKVVRPCCSRYSRADHSRWSSRSLSSSASATPLVAGLLLMLVSLKPSPSRPPLPSPALWTAKATSMLRPGTDASAAVSRHREYSDCEGSYTNLAVPNKSSTSTLKTWCCSAPHGNLSGLSKDDSCACRRVPPARMEMTPLSGMPQCRKTSSSIATAPAAARAEVPGESGTGRGGCGA
mmetsp:Transcript_35733/g.107978  ORF Transcript_35733/g.107978 Transcript_35733/m.107978 type:complete len:222 (+) Transcript_35733:732-1397(+)